MSDTMERVIALFDPASVLVNHITGFMSSLDGWDQPAERILGYMLLNSVATGKYEITEAMLAAGELVDIDFIEDRTKMAALHIAVAQDDIETTKLLIHKGASFFPDGQGRWPSVLAAECEVSEEMCDLIVEAEIDWLENHGGIPD